MLVYNLTTGKIIGQMPNDSDPYRVLSKHKDVQENNIGVLNTVNSIKKISQYMIKNNELIELNEDEEKEMQKYRRLLTEEERNQLPPPPTPPPTENEILKKQVTELQEVIDIMLGQGGS